MCPISEEFKLIYYHCYHNKCLKVLQTCTHLSLSFADNIHKYIQNSKIIANLNHSSVIFTTNLLKFGALKSLWHKIPFQLRCFRNSKNYKTVKLTFLQLQNMKSSRRHIAELHVKIQVISFPSLRNKRFVSTGSGRFDAVAAATWKRLLLPPPRRRSTASKT